MVAFPEERAVFEAEKVVLTMRVVLRGEVVKFCHLHQRRGFHHSGSAATLAVSTALSPTNVLRNASFIAYRVKQGDGLRAIAKRFYGNANDETKIFDVNRDVLEHPDLIFAEQDLRLPKDGFPWDEAPRYLIRDRDRIYGSVVTRRLRSMGIRDRPVDLFLGSGTTLMAAERTGRSFRGLDIDPAYVDVAIERGFATVCTEIICHLAKPPRPATIPACTP
jgi:DNA methylase/LysM domain